MASLLPLISEILPMILPSSTQITRSEQLKASSNERGDGDGIKGRFIEQPAIVNECSKMCASVLTTRPHSTSPIRHNSEQDAIVYAVSGTGILVVKEGFEGRLRRHELSAGDFAFVPAWTEHQAQNESDQDVVWVMTQSGPHPVGAVLTEWGGDEAKSE